MYKVGERGWEFFKPDVSGQIIPHDRSVQLLRQMMSGVSLPVTQMPQAHTQYVPTGGGATNTRSTQYDQRQTTNNFDVRSAQGMRLAMAQAKAFG
jgi:hypothetical protein